jgi:hypothetical protein
MNAVIWAEVGRHSPPSPICLKRAYREVSALTSSDQKVGLALRRSLKNVNIIRKHVVYGDHVKGE